jgi:4-alpha-glucanotransferase
MKKIKFVLGIHNHQPIGNFDFVFEDAYQKSYLPFLQVLERHPKIRISIHFTGILLDWLEENHPELIALVNKLKDNGQLEIMSGAYYEPIISVIPEADRIGQIKKLTNRVKEMFGYDASGMWLAERVWEPTLPGTLNDAGIKYSVIDDTHFLYAGLKDEDLNGYFISEDLGKKVFLFPISKYLRYTIPFQDPQATIDVLRNMASEDEERVLVFADDGEKFGVWPDTYQHVYENGWLDNFFTAVENNLDWIEMVTFDEVIGQVKPKSNIYLPTASYSEMMHWSLFKDTFKAYENFEHYLKEQNMYDDVGLFVRGGFWRNFMIKYPEINVMHKKMLRVSEKLARAKNISGLDLANDALWAGQCNCPYWHGVFGGLYLSHLRYAIFSNLIKAEKILAEKDPQSMKTLEISDFDKDGRDEVLIETKVHNAYFKPSAGGTLFEYDFKAADKNLLDTMTRREEGYHEKLYHAKIAGEDHGGDGTASIHDLVIAKEPGLEKYLVYDKYERKSFVDHIIENDVTPERFLKNEYTEKGDFVKGEYALDHTEVEAGTICLTLSREGAIWQNDHAYPIKITKEITIFKNTELIEAQYRLINLSDEKLNFRFAVEFNYGLQAGHADDRFYYNQDGRLHDSFLDSIGVVEGSKFLGLKDEYMKIDINISAEEADAIWRLPVETISLSEAGFEKVYQSSCVLLIWAVELQDETILKLNQKVSSF